MARPVCASSLRKGDSRAVNMYVTKEERARWISICRRTSTFFVHVARDAVLDYINKNIDKEKIDVQIKERVYSLGPSVCKVTFRLRQSECDALNKVFAKTGLETKDRGNFLRALILKRINRLERIIQKHLD